MLSKAYETGRFRFVHYRTDSIPSAAAEHGDRELVVQTERADAMLVVGTSGTVYPAAGFPVDLARRGGLLVEVNPEESDLTELMTIFLRGPAGALLTRLADRVDELRR